MHSIADLTTYCRKTTGDVPAKLVGASTTVIGSSMYLFGGRLVSERKMTSNLYIFDLETLAWELVPTYPGDDIPIARYFHSADSWNNHLVIFGGMGHLHDSNTPEDLCVLNDVRMFSLASRRWLPAAATNIVVPGRAEDLIPKSRYAHLSSVTADKLFIIGGQDLSNVWLDDLHVFDLVTKSWVQRRPYPRHCGTYRSIAVSSELRVRLPQEEAKVAPLSASIGPAGARFKTDKTAPVDPEYTQPETLSHLPYSAPPTDEFPCEIYLYSNYNFTAVKRELEVFTPLPDGEFTVEERSESMNGTQFPPGLRFPSGALLGNHFIVAGTYIANTSGSFSIWALDLTNMTWKHIDPGGALAVGSWFRGCLWSDANKFLVFGNRDGNLVDDYNRRLLAWDHVAVIDLESFGVYQPPTLTLEIPMQELGLSALEEGVFADFEIICDDGRKVKCSRKTLEERWPWFKAERRKFLRTAQQALDVLGPSSSYIPLPELPGVSDPANPRPDPRLTPRSFHLSEPYPVTLALLQYFYSLALLTPLQQAPAVLSQLLILASTYQITHLETLVKHAMHRALSNGTSVGVYEVATLCSCRSLQIRALKTVMNYSTKKPGGRSRQDSRAGGGGGGSGPGGAGGSGRPSQDAGPGHRSGSSGDYGSSARPRGTSDAQSRGLQNNGSSTTRNVAPTMSDFAPSTDEFPSPPRSPSRLMDATPSPKTPMFIHRQPHRPQPSVLSATADMEILAVAELMSPAISTFDNRSSSGGSALDDRYSMVEPNRDSSHFGTSQSPPRSLQRPRRGYQPSLPSFHDNDSDSDQSEYFSDPVAPRPPISTFHLPRRNLSYLSPSDSDTPSLTSSASYGSLTTYSAMSSPPRTPQIFSSSVEYTGSIPSYGFRDNRLDHRQQRDSTPNSKPHKRHTPIIVDSYMPHPNLEAIAEQSNPWNSDSDHHGRYNQISPPFSPSDLASLLSSTTLSPPSTERSQSTLSGMFTSASSKSSKSTSSGSLYSPTPSVVTLGPKLSKSKSEKELEKLRKAGEKARKKAEAKAKNDRLAQDLKDKAKKRKADQEKQSSHSGRSSEKRVDDDIAMFGGLGFSSRL